jgi:hypothetical protein
MDLKTVGITLLSSTDLVDMQTVGKTDLYTVPAGYTAYITHVIIRNPSASMAGGTDYDFGVGATATGWRQTVGLNTITSTADYRVIDTNNVERTECAAGSVFGIYVNTGTTAACTATIDVFGYLA